MFKYLLISPLARILSHPIQTLLSILGIAIGIANIIALISLSETAKRQTERLLNTFGANTIFITPYFDMENPLIGNAAVAASFLPPGDRDVVASLPCVDNVTAVLVFPTHVGYGAHRAFTTIIGTTWEMPLIRNYVPTEGRFYSREEEAAGKNVATLGSSAKRKIFGDLPATGEIIIIRGEEFTVTGAMEERGYFGFEDIDDRVYVPLTKMQELFKFEGAHNLLAAKSNAYTDEEAVAMITEALEKSHESIGGGENDFKVFTIKDFGKLRDKTFGIFSIILLGVGGIALFVAGIGIMNVMLLSVITRTKEVGIRKAVGASAKDIFLQFLLEAAFTCLIGAVIGIAAGVAAMVGITKWANWTPYISPGTILLAVVFSIVTGVVFGLLPAIRASRLHPIDALRYE